MLPSIEVTTVFADFEDLWTPFLGRHRVLAPAYVATLDASAQELVAPGHGSEWRTPSRTAPSGCTRGPGPCAGARPEP